MSTQKAAGYCLYQEFEAAPAATFCSPDHYLLYAASGRMRLEAEGQTWTLPPARAALIRADQPILVTLSQRVTANSVLFSPQVFAAPKSQLAVFEVSPLVRELLHACRPYARRDEPPDDYAAALFRALWAACERLSQTPSPAVMPLAQGELLRRALQVTEAELAQPQSFEELAARLGTTPRSLARHFQEELGMTYREALRRMRMIRAIELLVDRQASMSITQIAVEVGYGSLSAFNAGFREFAGRTPTDYRRSLQPG